MSKLIDVNFVWSQELALKASKLYYEYDMKNSSKRYIGWFFVALTQFGIVGALKYNSFGLLYLSTFLVLYWYYGRWYLRQRMIRRFYEKNAQDAKEMHFSIDENGLHYEDKVVKWENIKKVIPFDDGILIQTVEATLFFQNNFFKSMSDRDAFLKLSREEGKV